jgi:hypothetical protein
MTVADARRYLQGAAGKLAGRALAARTSVLIGDRPVAEAITDYAERSGVDLIALTTRGRGALSRLFRGSLAEEEVQRSGVSLLLCRPCDPALALAHRNDRCQKRGARPRSNASPQPTVHGRIPRPDG